ncbi:uncharacterized protein DDB_G0283697-like [Impatiens glandulifera]|uniref:uncharacterized protein DDB_G0283697-like n=1 Tax=Impatiens glandulifera TaxID=253017 RepID=UPI001FB14253|nr:uncharacterized protein DDB_G0283697-like [Impatiens glandulifera]
MEESSMEKSLHSGVDLEQIDDSTDDLFEGFTDGKRSKGEGEDKEPKEPTHKPSTRKRKAKATLKEANLKRKLTYDSPNATSSPASSPAPIVGCKCDELKEELKELKTELKEDLKELKIDIMTIKETQENHHAYIKKLEMKTNEGEDEKKVMMNEKMENEEKVNVEMENKDEDKVNEKMEMENKDEAKGMKRSKEKVNEEMENKDEEKVSVKEEDVNVKEDVDKKKEDEMVLSEIGWKEIEKKKKKDEYDDDFKEIDAYYHLLRTRIAKYPKTYNNKVAIRDFLLGDKHTESMRFFVKILILITSQNLSSITGC